ncbi:hypothetical protein HMPREF9088_0319 [Enterococcus italicus DSM 15952]|uniref:Uncharacterized protein n=1 Tax=Enterococcus italicus (strain DSM 15952 / CCUG 50447 / LMG 22039 / TP 1.5) TaxID=888064 RepID=E6LD79_ENTI1|nr:hypothetical protein HMPREF9088_0319 [Enterococcus italicus DSM 15952]
METSFGSFRTVTKTVAEVPFMRGIEKGLSTESILLAGFFGIK